MKDNSENINQIINSARSHSHNTIITNDIVINGLKFICENQNLDHIDLAKGLINIGCIFTYKDVIKQLSGDDTMTIKLPFLLSIIIEARDSEQGLSYIKEEYLLEDNDQSLYGYIRTITQNNEYTKEHICSHEMQLTLK